MLPVPARSLCSDVWLLHKHQSKPNPRELQSRFSGFAGLSTASRRADGTRVLPSTQPCPTACKKCRLRLNHLKRSAAKPRDLLGSDELDRIEIIHFWLELGVIRAALA